MAGTDPTALESHFAFGENWADFAIGIDERHVEQARAALERLLGAAPLAGCRFLDLGCGSGLHSVAALRLGASSALAVDLDPRSSETARLVLTRFGGNRDWQVRRASALELDPDEIGRFDVVYSWGVLHHTGSMWEAVRRAADLVGPRGRLAVALYRRTLLCPAWRLEKRLYNRLPAAGQRWARSIYTAAFHVALRTTGRSPAAHRRDYLANRGMDFDHDVHDWLGGWPYESARPAEVRSFVGALGFALEREFVRPGGLGVFGSGNDEFVFRRIGAPARDPSAAGIS